MNRAMYVVAMGAMCALANGAAGQSNPWADTLVSYVPGSNATAGYTNPGVALGEPTRFTGVSGGFPGAVTPFNAAWEPDEIVSIGEGGELIVRFDEPVLDDPLNPFGIDLLVFGNAWYVDTNWPNGIAGGVMSEGGVVSVSVNGSVWFEITGVQADGAFPTLGYLDLSNPYATSPGSVLSDFTRPVDPAFNATGRMFAEIVSAYGGSGGGVGIDIGAFGLSAISYVRVSNPVGSGMSPEIDAFADVAAVPSSGVLALLACVSVCGGARRQRR